MDGIYCNECGMGLDESPTLLPDRRPPCPRCGSLARRFEQEITDTVVCPTVAPRATASA